MTYQNKLEDYFWNNLQKDEFILDKNNMSPLDEVIKLMTLDEQELEIEINNRPELCKILGIQEHVMVGIEKHENEQSSSENEERHIVRMNKAKKEDPMDPGEGTSKNKRSGEKTYFKDLP